MNESKLEKVGLAVAGLSALILSGAVVASLVYLLLVVGSLLTIQPAFAQSTAGVQLEGAIEKEEVDGDLKSAIEVYQKIAKDSSASRDVRSRALLRLAGCYEKLGRQARQVYEQIVRDFADQPAAAQARRRLASLKQQEHPAPPRTMTQRKIEWSAVGGMGPSDTDGQRGLYRDSAGDLWFEDLAAQTKRMIFKAKPGYSPGFIPSRDFSMVYLRFSRRPDRPATVAVMKTDGTGYRELLRDNPQGTLFGWPDSPNDWSGELLNWSWDDRWLLGVSNNRKGGGRLWMISVADGRLRDLARVESGHFVNAAFSPDSHFVAYEAASGEPSNETSRIFVIPSQGGEPNLVYESEPRLRPGHWDTGLLDWTADGRYLAIADAPSGKSALYLLPVKNGAAAGKPGFIRYGEFYRMGLYSAGYTTAGGGLVYSAMKPGGLNQVYLASLDADGHSAGWQRLDLRGGSIVFPVPSFSPDSKQIAYVARDPAQVGGDALVLRDLATGQERVLHRSSGDLLCQWASQHPSVFCSETASGKTDLISLAVDSGEITRIASLSGFREIVCPSRDDRALYLVQLTPPEVLGQITRWEIASRQESVVLPPWDGRRPREALPSSDEQWLIGESDRSLQIHPMSGGDWRTLASISGETSQGVVTPVVTPDGNWVFYHDRDFSGTEGLFRVATAGGKPQRLGDFPSNGFQAGGLVISPDGHQIIASIWDQNQYDLWVLDNFVPLVKQ